MLSEPQPSRLDFASNHKKQLLPFKNRESIEWKQTSVYESCLLLKSTWNQFHNVQTPPHFVEPPCSLGATYNVSPLPVHVLPEAN
ncbi:hypothetical protein TV39_08945 [Arthrobacter sp. SPG23]|nr:hypothetical protein TV39_08945 [Arthrobacter sp. SPG23]